MTQEGSPSSSVRSNDREIWAKLEAQKKRQNEIRQHLASTRKKLMAQQAAVSSYDLFLNDDDNDDNDKKSPSLSDEAESNDSSDDGVPDLDSSPASDAKVSQSVASTRISPQRDHSSAIPVVSTVDSESEDSHASNNADRKQPRGMASRKTQRLEEDSTTQSPSNDDETPQYAGAPISKKAASAEPVATQSTVSTRVSGSSIPSSVDRPNSKRSVTSSVTMDMYVVPRSPSRHRDFAAIEGVVIEDPNSSRSTRSSDSGSTSKGHRRILTASSESSSSKSRPTTGSTESLTSQRRSGMTNSSSEKSSSRSRSMAESSESSSSSQRRGRRRPRHDGSSSSTASSISDGQRSNVQKNQRESYSSKSSASTVSKRQRQKQQRQCGPDQFRSLPAPPSGRLSARSSVEDEGEASINSWVENNYPAPPSMPATPNIDRNQDSGFSVQSEKRYPAPPSSRFVAVPNVRDNEEARYMLPKVHLSSPPMPPASLAKAIPPDVKEDEEMNSLLHVPRDESEVRNSTGSDIQTLQLLSASHVPEQTESNEANGPMALLKQGEQKAVDVSTATESGCDEDIEAGERTNYIDSEQDEESPNEGEYTEETVHTQSQDEVEEESTNSREQEFVEETVHTQGQEGLEDSEELLDQEDLDGSSKSFEQDYLEGSAEFSNEQYIQGFQQNIDQEMKVEELQELQYQFVERGSLAGRNAGSLLDDGSIDPELVEKCRRVLEEQLSSNNASFPRDDHVTTNKDLPQPSQKLAPQQAPIVKKASLLDPLIDPKVNAARISKANLSLGEHLSSKPKQTKTEQGDRSIAWTIGEQSQRSYHSRLSKDHSRIGGDPVWGAKKIYNEDEKVETELWVYLVSFVLFSVTTVGVTIVVLFVFGAAHTVDVDSELESELDPETSTNVMSKFMYLSSDEAVFSDENSPQYLALNWLTNVDEADIDFEDTMRVENRYSLAVLYFATRGEDQWTDDLNFLSAEHECAWASTASDGAKIGVMCDTDMKIANVSIVNNNLYGNIPTELSFLSSLVMLDLSRNQLFGTIPSLELEKLEHFNLRDNTLLGSIPESIGETLPRLTMIDFSTNSLSHTLPPTFQLLTNLESFQIGSNKISGTVPKSTLVVLKKLAAINLTDNNFEGPIDFLKKSQEMQTLDLSFNMFNGTVPVLVGELRNLRTMIVSHNQLQGTLPTTLGDMVDLRRLIANNNLLTGSLPWSVDYLGGESRLVEISLSDNFLSGRLPSHLDQFSQSLEVLDLHRNDLEGSIPFFVGSLSRLKRLDLSLNKLTGRLPVTLGLLTEISTIDLSVNVFSGTVPPTLSNLRRLKILALDNNEFTGTIPAALGHLETLERVSLHGNGFTGSVEFLCAIETTPVVTADCSGNPPRNECSCCAFCLG